jgi:RNA-binding protein 5/10
MYSGPTHVLVVRGLDENADEEMLRYEFSKHAPIKVLNNNNNNNNNN